MPIDLASPAVILNGGAVGLVLLVLFSLFIGLKNGHLYTKSAVEKIEKAEQARAAKAEEREDQWRQVSEKWQATALLATEQSAKLIEQGQLTVDLLMAIRDAQVGGEYTPYTAGRHRGREQ